MHKLTTLLFDVVSGKREDEKPRHDTTKKGSQLKSKQANNLEYEFLPEYLEVLESPPSSVARYFSAAIMVLIMIVMAWAYFGKVDIISTAPGKLIVDNHSKTIQSSEQGEVIAIPVRDGQKVNKGDLLIALNPTSTLAESQRLTEQEMTVELEIMRVRALLSADPIGHFNVDADYPKDRIAATHGNLLADYNSFRSKVASVNSQIEQNKLQQQLNMSVEKETLALLVNAEDRMSGYKALLASGNVSKSEYLVLEKELFQASRDTARIKVEAATLISDEAKLQQQLVELKTQNTKQLLDKLRELTSSRIDLSQRVIQANEKLRKMEVRSPVKGVVQQLAFHTIGGVVQPAQQLMVIVPENANLEAEVTVLNRDVGFVIKGQSVEVKVDSFPYTKYGTIKGEVIHVSRDSMKDEKMGLVYPTRIRLAKQVMQINNQQVKLSAGMSISAEIKTGERRVIDYILSPLKEYQSDSLKER